MTDPATPLGTGPEARLAAALREALSRNELTLVLQPIFDLASGRIACLEALVRWHLRGYAEIPPERFIDVADRHGLIHDIGEWGLAAACAHARQWIAAGHREVDVAVNFTANQFCHPGFVRSVRAILGASGLAAERLAVEVSEGAAMRDRHATATALAELKRAGAHLSLDDIGTAGAPDAFVDALPLDVLKVDISVTRVLPHDPQAGARLRSLVTRANAVGRAVLAEGVENEAQLAFLKSAGCHRAQGNLLGAPVAPEAVAALLSRHNGRAAPAARAASGVSHAT